MAEYIEREALKERFRERLGWLKLDVHDEYSGALLDGCEADMDLIDEIPGADVVPVVHGRWIKEKDSFQTDDYYCCYYDYKCSICNEIINSRHGLPGYCPGCGAKMDGGSVNE
jgi:hypothetical protein